MISLSYHVDIEGLVKDMGLPDQTEKSLLVTLSNNNLEEYEAVFTKASYTKGRPAKTYGPPEDCHPEEPAELELTPSSGTVAQEIIAQITRVCAVSIFLDPRPILLELRGDIEKSVETWLQDESLNAYHEKLNDYEEQY